MPSPSANHQADLTGTRAITRDQRTIGAADWLQKFSMGANDAVEHFLNHLVGVVEKLLHPHAECRWHLICLRALRKARIKVDNAISTQNTKPGRSIGHKHINETSAECCEKRWHFVEATRNRNTRMNLAQLVERDAYDALIKWPRNRLPTLIDETTGHNTDRTCCKILLQRHRFKKAARVNGGIGAKRRDTKQNTIGILKGCELLVKQGLVKQNIARLLRTNHCGRHDVDAACRYGFRKHGCTAFRRIRKRCSRSTRRLHNSHILQSTDDGLLTDRKHSTAPGNGKCIT
ncbi:hypothetical protein D3C80_455130 [compost metagenome]